MQATVTIVGGVVGDEAVHLHLEGDLAGLRLRPGDCVILSNKERGSTTGTIAHLLSGNCVTLDVPAAVDNRLTKGDKVTVVRADADEPELVSFTSDELAAQVAAAREEAVAGYDPVALRKVCASIEAVVFTGGMSEKPMSFVGDRGFYYGYPAGTCGGSRLIALIGRWWCCGDTLLAAAEALLAAVQLAVAEPEDLSSMSDEDLRSGIEHPGKLIVTVARHPYEVTARLFSTTVKDKETGCLASYYGSCERASLEAAYREEAAAEPEEAAAEPEEPNEEPEPCPPKCAECGSHEHCRSVPMLSVPQCQAICPPDWYCGTLGGRFCVWSPGGANRGMGDTCEEAWRDAVVRFQRRGCR